jgi:hypothetical protein
MMDESSSSNREGYRQVNRAHCEKAASRPASDPMLSSTSTDSTKRDTKKSPSLRIFEIVLILIGLALTVLSVLLPVSMGATTEYGVTATFRSGYVRVLTPFITNVSMASSFVVAAVILTFEKSKATAASVLFGSLTLSVFFAEVSLSLYLSVVRPLTARAPPLSAIYLLIGLVPLGLGFAIFTLASIICAR